MSITIWVDDIRPLPNKNFLMAKSTNEAINLIKECEYKIKKSSGVLNPDSIIIDLDHDSGDFFDEGGDYIHILDWLEATNRSYTIKIHTMNPVGRQNMENIIRKNNWKLIR